MADPKPPRIGLTGIPALEAEMRDRLACKDAKIDKLRDYIDRLTRFYIENSAWVALCEEARGYIGVLAERTQAVDTRGEANHE